MASLKDMVLYHCVWNNEMHNGYFYLDGIYIGGDPEYFDEFDFKKDSTDYRNFLYKDLQYQWGYIPTKYSRVTK